MVSSSESTVSDITTIPQSDRKWYRLWDYLCSWKNFCFDLLVYQSFKLEHPENIVSKGDKRAKVLLTVMITRHS